MDSVLSVLLCILVLVFEIPLAIIAHAKSLLIKNKRIEPTLSQRILAASGRVSGMLTTSLKRKILEIGHKGREQRKDWVKKLDANNEHDGWEGYLIADGAEQSEIGKDADVIILYAHGGGFIAGNALVSLDMLTDWIKSWKLSYGVNTQVLSLEYRISPEYSFPAARNNMLECYNWLVTEKKISPSKIVFAGDSAGGNLAIVSAIHLVNNPYDYSIDPPASIILISPFLSAIADAQSYTYNALYDVIDPVQSDDFIYEYIGDSNLPLSCPSISPLFEDNLSGLPKVLACVGGYEVFLDDVRKFIEKLIYNNVKAELVVEEANFHGYYAMKSFSRNGAYENSIKQIGKFLYK